MTDEAWLSERPWAGFVNGLQGGSKVKSFSHSLRPIKGDNCVLVTKNADCRMKQSLVLTCGPSVTLCLSFYICKIGIRKAADSLNDGEK